MRTRSYLLIFILVAWSVPLWAVVTEVSLSELVPSRANRQSTLLITSVIGQYHYRKVPLDDAFSARIMTRYLDTLDSNRSFFTREDVETFSVYNDKLDNAIKRAWLDPAFNIFRIYRKRLDEQVGLALSLLDKEFDFSKDEEYRFDRTEAPWAENQAALDELWRKRVKNEVLGLRLADKDDEGIRKILTDRYKGLIRRTHQLSADDVFQIFINAYTLTLEPHTSYMSPSISENFDISMRLSLEGIGAVLSVKNEHTVVQRTVPGGPAALSGKVHAGDRIAAVGQDEDGEMVDVVGWRLQDVVELIRGPKDSVVRLQILPEDVGVGGPPKMVVIVRDKIKLEDQAVKKTIIEGIDGMGEGRIGVITVPAFYRDFQAYSRGDKNFRSTTRDVRKLLTELTEEGVDGVVVDLRQNGGGSLVEATELTGLFIKTGPVVQVKDARGRLDIEMDQDPDIAYRGPLAVLVNRNSASASEIFAGAIQDYRRGIIIGEPTFGKGTVQTLIDLNNLVAAGTEQLGRLRLTMAQFFRVNGGSTQFRGVVPDIVYPTAPVSIDHGERALDNALPWARIDAVNYSVGHSPDVGLLQERHLSRIKSDVGFILLAEENEILQNVRNEHTVSLVETKRKGKWEARNKRLRDSRNRYRVAKGLEPLKEIKSGTDPDRVHVTTKFDDDKDNKNDGIKEIMVNEAALILLDQIHLKSPRSAALQMKENGVISDAFQDCALEIAGC